MNLKPIPNYEGLYSLDLNTNQVYGHKRNRYLKPQLENGNNGGYYQISLCKNNKICRPKLHRLIYEIYNGVIPDKIQVDHINGIRTDNRPENLRLATNQQNQRNTKTQKNNSTGYKCIYISKSNTYLVYIRINKKSVYNKTFKTLEKAIINRDIKLKEFHGEYANFD